MAASMAVVVTDQVLDLRIGQPLVIGEMGQRVSGVEYPRSSRGITEVEEYRRPVDTAPNVVGAGVAMDQLRGRPVSRYPMAAALFQESVQVVIGTGELVAAMRASQFVRVRGVRKEPLNGLTGRVEAVTSTR